MYDFDWSSIVPLSMPYLLAGLVITLKITVIAIVVGIVWGTLLAVMRLSSFCRWPGLLNPTSTYSAQSHCRDGPAVVLPDCPGFLQNVAGTVAENGIFA